MEADDLARDFAECLSGNLRQRLTVAGRCVPCAIADVERGDQAAIDGFAPEMSVQVSVLASDWQPRMGERVAFDGRRLRVTSVARTHGDPVLTVTLEPVQARG